MKLMQWCSPSGGTNLFTNVFAFHGRESSGWKWRKKIWKLGCLVIRVSTICMGWKFNFSEYRAWTIWHENWFYRIYLYQIFIKSDHHQQLDSCLKVRNFNKSSLHLFSIFCVWDRKNGHFFKIDTHGTGHKYSNILYESSCHLSYIPNYLTLFFRSQVWLFFFGIQHSAVL
jgi:hypothetical protein